MKKIISHQLILLIFIAFGAGLSSCNIDEATVVIPKTLEEYKLELSQFVSSEKAIVVSCVVGYNKGEFKASGTTNFIPYKTAYLTVLDAAIAILNKPTVTIAEIVAANKTLGVPGKNFDSNILISDRRKLNDPIVIAEALNAATLVGTAIGQVPQAAKTAFTTAITAAKTTRDAATTIDRQVDVAIVKLEDARKLFIAAVK